MKVTYYLNEGRKKNLYCRISDGKERVTFSLDYALDKKEWDPRGETVKFENEYHFTLIDFKRYLTEKYEKLKNEGKDNILDRLKNEALGLMEDAGVAGIAEKLFDYYNKDKEVPPYNNFIKAFEKYSNLNKGEYKVEAVGTLIHFHTKKLIYEMDTYEGKTANLRSIIEHKSYDEIYTGTSENIWSEIYLDGGFGGSISKGMFLPVMLKEWEIYWNKKYQDVREEVGKTDHLDEMKQGSWREFQVFMTCYDGVDDVMKLSYEIDDFVLFPLSVITMLKIFDAEACFQEYCEHEFFGNMVCEWESVELDEENDNSPMFFIREYEF